MMKVVYQTLKNFPEHFSSCNFMIHEKSKYLIDQQKINLKSEKINWIQDLKQNYSEPTIFLANEFFDALPIKQFFKRQDGWYEKFVDLSTLFLFGTVLTMYLGIGACLPIDKSLTLGLF